MGAPDYPHSRVLRQVANETHVVSLIGDDESRFIVSEVPEAAGSVITVVAAGPALTSERIRRRLDAWAAAFRWEERDAAVLALKREAGTAFAVAIVAKDGVLVFGDLFGAMPVFHSADGRIVATNPDAIGHAIGARYDPASYADMIATTRVCHPYTLYEGVRQLSPTAALTVSRDSMLVRESGYRPPHVAGDAIVDSAAASLDRILADHLDGRSAALAISGGLDSRVLASLVAGTAPVHAFTLTEKPSRDATIGALAAEHRGLPHTMVTVNKVAFARDAGWLVRGATSQNRAGHAHFAPLGGTLRGLGDTLVTGYGANANFERYESLDKVLRRIEAAEIAAPLKAEVRRRWTEHGRAVAATLGLEPGHLATVWPATQKKAYAFVLSNRHLMPTVDPFMLLPEMFSAKSAPGGRAPGFASGLFRAFCADEAHLPTTRHRHPLGPETEPDPSADETSDGWPDKGRMFRFARHRRLWRAPLRRLHPFNTFIYQLSAVDSVWHRAGPLASLFSRQR
jgi:hypothetical protein